MRVFLSIPENALEMSSEQLRLTRMLDLRREDWIVNQKRWERSLCAQAMSIDVEIVLDMRWYF